MKKLNMYRNDTSGVLITFCGLDGCGKTTMINKSVAELKKTINIFTTKQPTDFVRTTGIFRTYMDSPNHDAYEYRSLSLLAASDRVQHVNKVIVPAMKNGQVVISDRYYYSCLANLLARGYGNDEWIYEISESIVKPDISFFLDVPVDIAVSRVRKRAAEKDRYIDMELQYKLRELYIEICKINGGILISTEQPPEATYSQIINEIKKVLEAKK